MSNVPIPVHNCYLYLEPVYGLGVQLFICSQQQQQTWELSRFLIIFKCGKLRLGSSSSASSRIFCLEQFSDLKLTSVGEQTGEIAGWLTAHHANPGLLSVFWPTVFAIFPQIKNIFLTRWLIIWHFPAKYVIDLIILSEAWYRRPRPEDQHSRVKIRGSGFN